MPLVTKRKGFYVSLVVKPTQNCAQQYALLPTALMHICKNYANFKPSLLTRPPAPRGGWAGTEAGGVVWGDSGGTHPRSAAAELFPRERQMGGAAPILIVPGFFLPVLDLSSMFCVKVKSFALTYTFEHFCFSSNSVKKWRKILSHQMVRGKNTVFGLSALLAGRKFEVLNRACLKGGKFIQKN